MQVSQSQVVTSKNQVHDKTNHEPSLSDENFDFDNHLTSAKQNFDLFDQKDSTLSKGEQSRKEIEEKRDHDIAERNDEMAIISQSALIKQSDSSWKSKTEMAKSSVQQAAIQEKVDGQKARYRTPTIQENGVPEQAPQETSKTDMLSKSQKPMTDTNVAEPKFDDIQNQIGKKGNVNVAQEIGKNLQFKFNQNPIGSANASIIASNQNQSSMNQQMNREGSAFGNEAGKFAVKSAPAAASDTVSNSKQFQSVLQSKQAKATQSNQIQMQQIVDKVKMILSSNKSEMIIKLSPEHLGKLEVKLKKTSEGMTGTMKVESQMVKELLEPQLGQLQQSLEQQGVKLEDLSILVNDQSNQESMFAGFENQTNSEKSFETGTQNASIKSESINTDEINSETPVRSNANSSGMSIYA